MRPSIFALVLAVAVPCLAAAQDAVSSSGDPVVTATVSNLTRVETWRFFEPILPEVDPDYTFWANRSDLLVRARGRRVDLDGGFAYVRVENLPDDAIGPGGLGTGAFYFASSGVPYSYQVFLTSLTLSFGDANRRWRVAVGRMPYTSGREGVQEPGTWDQGTGARDQGTGGRDQGTGGGGQGAADVKRGALAAVRRLVIDGRLIGTFEWSLYQRRFDGMRADWRGRSRYAGGSLFLVSQGGYEESANLTMDRLQIGTAYAGQHHGDTAESQVFGVLYRDRRHVDIRPDNSLTPVTAADVTIGAVGASHVASRPVGTSRLDYAGWGAWQLGDWYGQTHRAFSVAAQGGVQWADAPWAPWIRVGASYASGDEDGRDDAHGTFFPMLQETRSYAQSMVYAHANLRDLFGQLHLSPHPRVTARVDVHRLDLVDAADRWYQGSGATARDGRFFGYSSRASAGARGLGTLVEGSAGVRLSRYWSINGYLTRMRGGPVVRASFVDDRLFYWYVENVLRLTLGS